ncbi:GntR family transcriptional regulator [bacterium LRH843]|nr:GntR family transcriptional regulator [bacterium LRH843]
MNIDKLLSDATYKTKNIKSLRDVALEFLREAIFIGYYKPGDHLKEREISKLLGISTTPVKEALRILGHEGIVETIPRKGTFVSELIDTSIEEFMMLKAELEGLASRLAALKITDHEIEGLSKQIEIMRALTHSGDHENIVRENFKFHMLIREAAKSPMLCITVNNVVAFDNAFRKRALRHQVEIEEGFLEHKKIYEAIKDRNADLAEDVMKNHIMRTAAHVLAHK